jgi:N6-L-threonylcarbamoyladenine synthase
LAAEFQEAVSEVLVAKAIAATRASGFKRLVVAGGVGANRRLRSLLAEKALAADISVFHPPLAFCTDNGAMVAFAAALRLAAGKCKASTSAGNFTVRPRWDLEELSVNPAL